MTIRDQLKRLSGESLVYGLGQVGGKAVNLLLVPVLTRVLLRQQYGVADLVISYSASALLVLVCGMDAALARFFYDEPDREARVRMVSSSLVFRMIVGVAAASALWLLADPLANALLGGVVYAKYLRIGAAALPFTLLTLFANDVLRVTFQPWKFIALNVTQTALVGGITVWLVWGERLGVAGVLYGKLAGDAITAAIGLVLCRHALAPRFSRATLRRMFRYGAPLVPAALAYGVIGFVDRYFLQRHASLDAVGDYAVAMKFFAVVTLGVSAFQLAFGPFAFERARDPNAPTLYARILAMYVGVASLGAMLVGLFAPGIVAMLATREYAGAASPALWLSFAAVAQGAYYVAALGLNLSYRTALLGWTACGAALVAVVANAILTPRFGAEGAAAATFLGYASSVVLAYVVAQRIHPLPYRGARLAALFLGALGLSLATARLAPPGLAGVAVKLAAGAAYAAVAWRSEVWRDRGAVRHRPAATET